MNIKNQNTKIKYMRKILLIISLTVSLAFVYANSVYAKIGAPRAINGHVYNAGGIQPILSSFFGVELGKTSFRVAEAILDETYGNLQVSEFSDSRWITCKVYWYGKQVRASFRFRLFYERWILKDIFIECDEDTVKYIVKRLNHEYGKGDPYNDYVGAWGTSIFGEEFAIYTEFYEKLEGFHIDAGYKFENGKRVF